MSSETTWKIIFVTSVTMARVGQGMYLSIPGPTLLFLTEIFSVDVSRISVMFILRSLGMIIGALGYSLVMYKFNKFNPLLACGPGTFLLGLTTALVPWYSSYSGLLVSNFVSGFMFSLTDGAMQTLYLRIWGIEKSRPFIQSFHFGISLGGLVTPIIASPFLQMADQADNSDPGCPSTDFQLIFTDSSAQEPITPYSSSNLSTTAPLSETVNPISWSYVIVGGFSVLASIPLFAFWGCGLEGRIAMNQEEENVESPEEPIKDVWYLLLLLCGFYFLNDTLEATYANYIYSVALCMGIGFSVADAAYLNSIFWVGYTISRLVAIIYSKYFKPRTIIIYGIVMIVLAMISMCLFGQKIALVVWICTLFFGVAVAPFYPTGVTWASRHTNVSGRYMFVFMFSAGLDSMIMLPVAGILFESSPFYVMYLVTGAAVAIGVVFFGMEKAARIHSANRVAQVLENNHQHKKDLAECDNYTKL